MKQFAKRAIAVFTMIVLAAGVSFALSACGGASNDEKLIKDGISEVLDNFKNPTKESLSEYVGGNEAALASLDAYGVDYVELFQHLFKHFDYTIDDVKVNGDTAVVKLTVENVNLEKALSEASTAMQSDPEFVSEVQAAYVSGGEQAMYKLVFQKMYDAIDSSTDIVKNQMELTCTKTNGQWAPDDESVTELVSKVYGGLDMSSL